MNWRSYKDVFMRFLNVATARKRFEGTHVEASLQCISLSKILN